MNGIKTSFIYFFVTLAGYALILYLFPKLEIWIPSYIYHVLMIVFPLALILFGWENRSSLGLVNGRWKFGVIASVMVIALSFFLNWIFYRHFSFPTINHIFFATVIWGPIAEELFFRGYLQPKFKPVTGKWLGLTITALLFGISHLPRIFLREAAPLILLPEAFALGIVFGFIRDKTGSTYYGMVCHMAYNLIVSVIFF